MSTESVQAPLLPARLRPSLALAGLLAALSLVACGGGDEGDSREQDRVAIERINTAVAESDAAAWCEAFSPESVTETFGSPARCRRETAAVIEGSDRGRRLRLEAVAYEGEDRARIRFSGAAGEANLTRIDGEWYLDLLQEVDARPVPDPDGGDAG
jgi:hypothetical protein